MRDIHMSTDRFVDHINEGYNANLRYCFILGAGASYTSGIPTGLNMMPEWRDYLLQKGIDYISECAIDCGFSQDKWEHIFSPDYKLNSEDYFTLFDLRFAGNPIVAYHYLQEKMENAEPSIGYYMLAVLMEHTENKLVITTNFDSLIEDVLHMYHAKHPLVAGHESLAPYIVAVENNGRPVIAKVHRDLMLRPLNREDELKKLSDSWKESLQKVLTKYIPIVIGYAGGDQTLMNLLESLSLDSIYWCSLHDKESDRIEQLLHNSKGGYLVKIQGFDDILFKLTSTLTNGLPIDAPEKRIKKYYSQRITSYRKQFLLINDKVLDESTSFDYNSEPLQNNSFFSSDPIPESNYSSTSKDSTTVIHQLNMLDKLASKPTVSDKLGKAATLRRDAIRHIYNNETDKALTSCNKALELQPKDADLHLLKGLILHASKQFKEALEYVDIALSLTPNDSYCFYSRSIILRDMGKLEEAMANAKKAIEIDSTPPIYHESLASIYRKMKTYEKSLEESEKAIRLAPDNPRYRVSRGLTLEIMKRYEEAEKDLKTAINMEPNNALYHLVYGMILDSLKRYDDALSEFEDAYKLDPEFAHYYYFTGRILIMLSAERYDKALKIANEAINQDPNDAEYYYYYSLILQSMNQPDEALKALDKAISISPNNADYHDNRSQVYMSMYLFDKAIQESQIATKLEPRNASYHQTFASALYHARNYEEALSQSNISIKLDPIQSDFYDTRAMILSQLKRYDEALKDYNHAIKLNDTKSSYYYGLSSVLKALNRYEEAIQSIEKALELDPNNTDYIKYRKRLIKRKTSTRKTNKSS